MVSVISRPTKSFTSEGPTTEINAAIERLTLFTKTYKLNKAELIGTYVDTNCYSANETQSKISIKNFPVSYCPTCIFTYIFVLCFTLGFWYLIFMMVL